jgi:hypothetical protein
MSTEIPRSEYIEAGLTRDEVSYMHNMNITGEGTTNFYGTRAFDKLFSFYLDNGQMPYQIAKARGLTSPDQWILYKLGF